jgi:flavin-binding protein dodecin
MDDHVFKHIRVTGTSTTTMEEAVQKAVVKAAKTVRNMRWFQVVDTRGAIKGDAVEAWQVTIEVGFRLD